MATKIHRTQIYLKEEQYQYLRQQAERKKASIAEIVREMIDERLPKEKDYEDNPLFSLGKDGFSMGRRKGSVMHDDHIYRRRK
ncbi:MAG: ribbon-helix-helix protein, CopG family [Deferribacteres bacterium]|nr:ribbon-helix-helix protein, CopG family [Deferribacteres bacterium]